MDKRNVPASIQAFFNTTNSGNAEGFVAAFTRDAFLDDWGRAFHGREGVARWNQTDNIGKHAHFDVQDIHRGSADDEYVATVTVSGGGYNGPGLFTFHLADGLISRFIIG